MIEISHLVKKYGSHYAVKDLNVIIRDGRIYGFLGPNGAGKSTTMNIITGYLAPTAGEVKINGHDIIKEPEEAKKQIGYLPEIPPLYQDMTVEEYLSFAASLKKIPKAKRKEAVESAVQLSGLTEVRCRLIANLSKGFRQRVGLAQAVLGDPKIIILDEPTVGLDPKQMIEMRDLIRNLKKKHTVILSSHILSEVSAVCDEILIIHKGELVANDTADGLKERMNGSARLQLTIKAKKAALAEVLDAAEGIESYIAAENGDGLVEATIQEKAGADIREELFYRLAERKMPILELKKDGGSLEDIFLQLTEKSTGESPEAEEDMADSPGDAGEQKEDEVAEDDSDL